MNKIPVIDVRVPSFMGMERKVRDGAPKRNQPIIPEKCYYNFYVHGMAERDLGFDIPVILDGEVPSHTGVYDCILNQQRGTLVLWDIGPIYTTKVLPDGNTQQIRYEKNFKGLAFYKCDLRSLLYALKMMKKRSGIL